jgi:hypothetical protein
MIEGCRVVTSPLLYRPRHHSSPMDTVVMTVAACNTGLHQTLSRGSQKRIGRTEATPGDVKYRVHLRTEGKTRKVTYLSTERHYSSLFHCIVSILRVLMF